MSAKKEVFLVPLSSGIFEHYPKMKEAVWLFIWYIDKTTLEDSADGGLIGYVLGKKPIKDSDVSSDLGCHRATAGRWRLTLEAGGYIKTKATPVGHVIRVLKSKKWILINESARNKRKNAPGTRKNAHTYRQHKDNTVTRGVSRPLTEEQRRILAYQEELQRQAVKKTENEEAERAFQKIAETPEDKAVLEKAGLL